MGSLKVAPLRTPYRSGMGLEPGLACPHTTVVKWEQIPAKDVCLSATRCFPVLAGF